MILTPGKQTNNSISISISNSNSSSSNSVDNATHVAHFTAYQNFTFSRCPWSIPSRVLSVDKYKNEIRKLKERREITSAYR